MAARLAVALRVGARWRRALPRRPGSTLAVVLIGALFAFPFYWVITTSFDTSSEVYSFPPRFFPGGDAGNYARAWGEAPWVHYFLNTVLIAGCTVVLVLATSLLAGFALGVMRYRGREICFVLVLMILMVPQVVLIIPDYIVLDDIHWLNTYWAQIVPWGASVFGIFLLRQFFQSLPEELIEAAELDGASQLRFLWKVAAPLAWPAIITIGLYVFIGSWDSFLWPFIMTSSASVQPIEVGLATFLGTNGTDWTGLSAAVVFTSLPVMVVFMLSQRRLVEGAFAGTGAVKG
ncbi:MAG: carbohydrate ABC transporter permease [Actinomycetota bacterium]|nr:carbohydrate ABC transporter permease [Actinomycetota bacterium]